MWVYFYNILLHMKTRIVTSSLVLIEVRPGTGEPYSADRTGTLPNHNGK